jgi:hypothetical protein
MEVWKTIPNYQDYEVSNFGNVKSKKFNKEKILKPQINNAGYYNVILSKEKKIKNIAIHQLVAMSFLNHLPNGKKIIVDHIDNNKLNNNLYNLQLVSFRYNISKSKSGTSKYTGVSWNKKNKKWMAQIQFNSINKNLGYFENEYDAYLVYEKELQKTAEPKTE